MIFLVYLMHEAYMNSNNDIIRQWIILKKYNIYSKIDVIHLINNNYEKNSIN